VTSGKGEKKTFFCNKPDHEPWDKLEEMLLEKNEVRYNVKSNCLICISEWLNK